jgi:hypothetical protein
MLVGPPPSVRFARNHARRMRRWAIATVPVRRKLF